MEEMSYGDHGGIRDAKGIKSELMPAASSLLVSKQVPQSDGENFSNMCHPNGKKHPRFITKTLESGSGSGDQHEDGTDVTKKRRTRRGKPKHRKLKPYSKHQLFYQQRLRSKSIDIIAKTGRQPPAPYNTTQFLMNDHSDLPDLEQKLLEAASLEVAPAFQKPPAPARTRDSSFSVDSDEDYFYSSPEDEEEFLTKEFSTAYEDLHAERLNTLTKSELIQEYIQLEAKVDLLTKRLRNKNFHQTEERDSESKNISNTDSETAKKLKLYQQRIDDLIQQNEQLRRDIEMLRTEKILRADISESSVDSESDSDSSSSSNRSRCSCSLSTAETSKHNYKSRLDNNLKTDSKNDNCDTSQTESPKALTTSTNLSNGHIIMHETDSFLT